ncbi:MAG: biopolymer transporter ExbD [Planctomycetes bacterium]|nr:biopolymer transporter ExbD [Planctomycetota bacterium]
MKVPVQEEAEAVFAMAPMIDMVFLLLVFFMCASHLSTSQNVAMEIPIATKAVVPKERPDRWTVNITKDGTLFSGSNPVVLDDLTKMVRSRMKEDPKLKVYIRADANTAHKEVKKVMNALAEVGMDNFIFGVFQPRAGEGTSE